MILRGSGPLRRVRKRAAGPLLVASAKADRGRYPWGKGLRVKRRVEGLLSQGARAWEAWVEAAKRLCEQPPSPRTPFRLLTLSPSRGRPCPGDNGESSCFRPAGDRGGKGIPGPGGRQATVVRVSRRWFETNAAEPTSNFAPSSPLAFFIPQLPGRLVSASTDRDPHSSRRLSPLPNALKVRRTGLRGRSEARPGAPESQTHPRRKGSHPPRGNGARPDAANSSYLHWRHDGTIPPRPARPETQGAELPCSRHAAGAQHPGRGGRGLRWEGDGARGLAGGLWARAGEGQARARWMALSLPSVA